MGKPKTLKALCIIMSAALASQIFITGCSSEKGGQKGTQTTQAVQTTADNNPTRDFVTLSWYMRKPVNNLTSQTDVEAEANKIIKEKINANLHFNFVDTASWEEKMKLMSAAGETYDIAFSSNAATLGNRLDVNVQRGSVIPLDDLLKKYGEHISQKVDSRAWNVVTYGGKIMAIPSQLPYSSPRAFVFKKELVEKYKFDYKNVKTLADLEPYLETIKKNEPGMVPLFTNPKIGPQGMYNFNAVEITKGVSFDEKSGKVMITFDIPESVALYKKVSEYYQKGYIAKDAATKTDTMAEIKSGKYAVMSDPGGYTEDGSKSSGIYGFPCVEALYGYPLITTLSMTATMTVISKTSKNPERSMMLLDLIWSDRTLSNTLAYGVEGKNYTVTSGKGTDNPTVEAKSGAEQTWAIWHNFLGPLWDQWDSNWNSTKALEQMQENNKNAKASVINGFLFNNEAVKSEVAQVNAVVNEIEPIIYTGVAPDVDKYLAEAKQKLKNAGIDRVMDEVQKQMDEWKAKNK